MAHEIPFKTLGKVAGIGGIAIGAVIFIFSQFLRRSIFPTFSTDQAYNILRLMLLLTFAIGVIGVVVWAYTKGAKSLQIVLIFIFASLIAYMGNQRLEFAAGEEKKRIETPGPSATPSATPIPTIAGSPTPTPTPLVASATAPMHSSKSQPTASSIKSQSIRVLPDETEAALNGEVSVSLIGIKFEGDPLRHRASFRVRTPAGSGTYEKRDVGQIVTFPGYEIRLTKVDTFAAEFEILRTHK